MHIFFFTQAFLVDIIVKPWVQVETVRNQFNRELKNE